MRTLKDAKAFSTHRPDTSVFLITDLNLSKELVSSKVLFKLFYGLIARWVKKLFV